MVSCLRIAQVFERWACLGESEVFVNIKGGLSTLLSKSGYQESEEYNYFEGVLYGKEAKAV
jgi:hypothetical protein